MIEAHRRMWTDRVLTTLEHGVKGGRWFSLIDKMYALPTLRAAFARVKANRGSAGVDHVTIEMFEARLEEHPARLARELRDGTHRSQPIRRVWIPKPGRTGRRPLGVPTVRDRVVQTALRLVLEPIFERDFAAHSYGFRPRRRCRDALRRVDGLLRRGYVSVVDADLKSYFDSITEREAHRALALVSSWVPDAGLALHPDKTRIVDARARGGFDFLGYHFERGHRGPSDRSLAKIKDTIRACTPRVNGQSLDQIISDLNSRLRGWFGYFQHSSKLPFRKLDRMVRRRLRRILRKRHRPKRRRRRGLPDPLPDHVRWPNAFFAEQGLFSLLATHAAACQSSRR